MLTTVAMLLLIPAVHSAVTPVPFTDVRMQDAFWAPKIETNRRVTIPYAFGKDEETGRKRNFENAAATLKGEDPTGKPLPGYPFDDTDVYKVVEGASYSLAAHPDPKLDAYVDKVIAEIAAAQEPDGYLYTARTINPAHPHPWSGNVRWVNEEDQSHELYCLGHLYEAAVAHYQATGKRTLLNVAIKSANLLDRTFGLGKRQIWPGHEIVEMGLVKLGRVTNEPRYIALAKFFLDCRHGGGDYWQAQAPVVDQSQAVGHAVRAAYLYSGMADVAATTGNAAYAAAIDRIWNDVVDRKLYVTGGIGAMGSGEAFGPSYYLPNASAYCETCAAVGNDYWNDRLFLLHGDARYFDVFERTLYNGLLSGVGLDGKSFFYPNPLESSGGNERSPWFGCACCPGNITRFMPSVPGYFYALREGGVFVNLYASNTADFPLEDGPRLRIVQRTRYPWDGDIKLAIAPAKPTVFDLKLRIPGWARNEPVPSDLYRFVKPDNEPVRLLVNGRPAPLDIQAGYATIRRRWKAGDAVELVLPMPVRRVVANTAVRADRGRVALERGPIVFCAEWPDNPGGKVRNLLLSDSTALTPDYRPKLLDGVVTLDGTAEALREDASGHVRATKQRFCAIPYYAWANRGKGEMEVWLSDDMSSARPMPHPTVASMARVRTSGGTNPEGIHDLHIPASSVDQADFVHWWPKKGSTEWVEFAFAGPAKVSESDLYWFDDTGIGECRVPASWRILYKDGTDWKPIEPADYYGVAKDRYNVVHFKPVMTSALRLEVQLKPNWSAGIQQWVVK